MPRNRGTRTRVATGVYRDAQGHALVAMVGGVQRERRAPRDWSLRRLIDARDAFRAELRAEASRAAARRPTAGTLAADAPRYLASVRQMPSYRARFWQIEKWVDALGDRHRDDITTAMVATQLHTWLADGYAPQTCNHLRTALLQLYRRLDGPDARNPARAVPKLPVEAPVARALPVLAVARILHALRPRTATRARLAVMATTGLSQAELVRVQADDIDWRGGTLLARARRKGAGSHPRLIPLTRHARLALRWFVAAEAFGPFSTAAMRSRFRDACERAGYGETDWRPYDLRHTFATLVAAAGDERAVQAVLGHTTTATTRRYTLGSVDARVQRAVLGLDQRRSVDRRDSNPRPVAKSFAAAAATGLAASGLEPARPQPTEVHSVAGGQSRGPEVGGPNVPVLAQSDPAGRPRPARRSTARKPENAR